MSTRPRQVPWPEFRPLALARRARLKSVVPHNLSGVPPDRMKRD
jgi:hypothetical protein